MLIEKQMVSGLFSTCFSKSEAEEKNMPSTSDTLALKYARYDWHINILKLYLINHFKWDEFHI